MSLRKQKDEALALGNKLDGNTGLMRNVEVMSKDHEVSHKHQPEVVKDVYHAEPVIPENASIDKSDTVHGEGGDVKVIHREEDKVKDFQHQGEKESPKKDPLIKIKGAGAEKLKLGKFLKGKSGEKKEKKIDFEKDKDRLVKPEDKEEKEKKKKEKIKARRKLQKERKREKKKQQIPVSAEKKVQNKEEATDPSFTIESKGTEDQGESGKEHVQFDQFQKQGNGDKEIKADEIPLKFTDGTELKVPDHKALEITGVNTEEAGKVDTY